MVMSSSLNPPLPSTSRPAPSTILLLPLHRRVTVEPMLLGRSLPNRACCSKRDNNVTDLDLDSYLNGSILIAAIQPSFNILHTLNTLRAPSPIVTLAWHASSAKQKSDMLAAQTEDGDLRVWSIPKAPNDQAPQVIRILRKSDNYEPGPNWLAWSKNGRIVQYSEG